MALTTSSVFLKYYIILICLLVSFLSKANTFQQGNEIHYIQEKNKDYNLQDIQELYENGQLKKTNKTLNLGYSIEKVWLVINTQIDTLPRVITIQNPHLDNLNVFFFSNDSIIKTDSSGDLLPFKNRFTPSNFFNFLIPENTNKIIIEVQSQSLIHIPISIQPLRSYISEVTLQYLIYGLFYGFLVLTLVSSLKLFIWLKDPLHLYFSIFLVVLGLIIGAISNLIFQFLWPNAPVLNQYHPIVFLAASFFLFFTEKLLNIKKNLSKVYKFYQLIYLLIPILIVFIFATDYRTSIRLVYYLVIIIPLVSLISSILLFKKTSGLYNKLFLTGWIFFILSIIVFLLIVAQVLSFFFIPSESILIGSALQVVFFNLAILSKVSTLQREKQELLTNQNKKLEGLVGERTRQLESKKNEVYNQNLKLEEQKNELQHTNKLILDKNNLLKNQHQNLEKVVDKRTRELVKMNTSLRESERQFKFLADSIPQIVYALDTESKIEYINKKWTEYTGQTFEGLKEKGWKWAIHPEDWPILKNQWSESIKSGNPLSIVIRIFRASDKTFRWHISRAEPFKSTSDQIIKWFGTSTDIHDEKINQEKVQVANKELKKINQDLDNFIYLASHEIRVPVANIEGLINDLKETIAEKNITDQDIAIMVEMVIQSLSILKSIVNDLIQISVLQKKEEYIITKINIKEVVEESQKQIATLINSTNAQIETEIECREITFSKEKLKNIFYHLLTNAILYKHPDRKPKIKVTCKRLEDYYYFTVTDNGLGISKESQHKLFRMFRRIHTHVEGVGIGLYTVKRILENFSGKIEAESQEGVGSTFKFYIPVKLPE